MRALTRMRLLAAACALLLTFASTARSSTPKPIDRPDSPPDPPPVQVGDPDQPPSLVTIPLNRWFAIRVPTSWITQLAQGSTTSPARRYLMHPSALRKVSRGR
jgi:hypothetical protein